MIMSLDYSRVLGTPNTTAVVQACFSTGEDAEATHWCSMFGTDLSKKAKSKSHQRALSMDKANHALGYIRRSRGSRSREDPH